VDFDDAVVVGVQRFEKSGQSVGRKSVRFKVERLQGLKVKLE
jgi:hypothetical protein